MNPFQHTSYIIRHAVSKDCFIEEAGVPPWRSKWTKAIEDAQKFESENEAQEYASYMTKTAFKVEVAMFKHNDNHNSSNI